MANRPVFISDPNGMTPYKVEHLDFKYYSGFNISQKRKSIESLHNEYLKKYPKGNILEISSYSSCPLGVQLSAFNLKVMGKEGRLYSVESIFQSSKVFERGGPFTDILFKTSLEAKKDERLKSSGNLIGFKFHNVNYPIEPKTFFYNWIYLNVLNFHPELWEQIITYNAFTDIGFNPQKQYNCQAESVAIFVGLIQRKKFKESMKSLENFLHYVYPRDNTYDSKVGRNNKLVEDSLFPDY